jgi:D-alanyl-D-alanine carboxypeptidase (penicillin-binding protein 5/6)
VYFIKLFIFTIIFISSINSIAVTTKAKQTLLVDADSGAVLYKKNDQQLMAPSSMSKLMTIYLVFEKLKNGSLKINDEFIVSEKAWKKQGTRMFLELNKPVKVEDLLRGVIIVSGNDASITLAEGIAGTEEDFAIRMNAKAKELGLKNSHFVNATGWPDKGHVMTVSDLAILSKRIMEDFPEYYHYFAEKSFKYNKIEQQNRNLLLNRNIGSDGLKTGHSSLGGYGIAASAIKDNRRLILVVNGLDSEQERANEAQNLLQYGFLNFTNVVIAKKNQPLVKDVKTWLASPDIVNLITKEDVVLTFPIDQKSQISAQIIYETPINANVKKTQPVGNLLISLPNGEKKTVEIYLDYATVKQGLFGKIISWSKHYITNFTFDPPEKVTKAYDLVK